MRYVLSVMLVCVALVHAEDKPAIVFPDVDGWAKGRRYDRTPGAPADTPTTINYTTKAKVGGDYVRVDVAIHQAGGKSIKDVLPTFEKKIADNPVLKNTKKTIAKEIDVSKTKVTQVTFATTFSGDPTEYVLHVFAYGDYLVKLEQRGPAADSAKRAAETLKLLKALVDAASAK